MTRSSPVRHIDPATFKPTASVRAILDAPPRTPARPVSSDIAMRWHPAFVAPTAQAAERVQDFVERLGFSCWWPVATMLRKRRRRSGEQVPGGHGGRSWVKHVVRQSRWPQYLLISLPKDDAPFGRLSDDRARRHGLIGIIATSSGPAVIPNAVVEDLQRRQAAGEWDETVKRGSKIEARRPSWAVVGGEARVVDGPFASFEAVIEELIGERARIAVSIFGRSTPVDVELDQLGPRR